jgi:hypothetical protein
MEKKQVVVEDKENIKYLRMLICYAILPKLAVTGSPP